MFSFCDKCKVEYLILKSAGREHQIKPCLKCKVKGVFVNKIIRFIGYFVDAVIFYFFYKLFSYIYEVYNG